jgi:hypothetical protein
MSPFTTSTFLLASVDRDDLARLTQVAGDLQVAQGEYAVHEGANVLCSWFVGPFRSHQVDRRYRRTIGVRAPGQIFGGAITFGTPFRAATGRRALARDDLVVSSTRLPLRHPRS